MGKLNGDDAWLQLHGGWNPSSTAHDMTFTVGQAAEAHGRAPRQRRIQNQRGEVRGSGCL